MAGNKTSNYNCNGDPVIRRPLLLLLIAALVVYFPTMFYGYTQLDDQVLILQSDRYNEHWVSLLTSFRQGVFGFGTGHYYRPLFLDSIILNYKLCGKHIAGYHVVNVALHVTAVVLLYKLFLKLRITPLHSFLLCLAFAVHPVLSQAVAWVPGRNDTLLAIFAFAFFIASINYSNTGQIKQLLLAVLYLLLALFTKESAAVIPFVALLFLTIVLQKKWQQKQNIVQYLLWIICVAIWWVMRTAAHVRAIPIAPRVLIKETLYRTPVILQYLGKIFFPFNLSVSPSLKETTIIYGLIATATLLLILYLPKNKSWRMIAGGAGIFLILLLPVLLLPHALSVQTYEHRLYLPIIGVLLILPQTSLMNNRLGGQQVLKWFVAIAIVLAGINFYHQRYFASPAAFWSQAAASTKNNTHACIVLGMQEKDPAASYSWFQKAYQINPHEKFLNFCRGVKLQSEDSILASEPYLIAEKKSSGYFECDYYLARVAVKKNNLVMARSYLQLFLTGNPNNKIHTENKLLANPEWLKTATAKEYAMRLPEHAIALTILTELGL